MQNQMQADVAVAKYYLLVKLEDILFRPQSVCRQEYACHLNPKDVLIGAQQVYTKQIPGG